MSGIRNMLLILYIHTVSNLCLQELKTDKEVAEHLNATQGKPGLIKNLD